LPCLYLFHSISHALALSFSWFTYNLWFMRFIQLFTAQHSLLLAKWRYLEISLYFLCVPPSKCVLSTLKIKLSELLTFFFLVFEWTREEILMDDSLRERRF
jgi:hypothetical protein